MFQGRVFKLIKVIKKSLFRMTGDKDNICNVFTADVYLQLSKVHFAHLSDLIYQLNSIGNNYLFLIAQAKSDVMVLLFLQYQ